MPLCCDRVHFSARGTEISHGRRAGLLKGVTGASIPTSLSAVNLAISTPLREEDPDGLCPQGDLECGTTPPHPQGDNCTLIMTLLAGAHGEDRGLDQGPGMYPKKTLQAAVAHGLMASVVIIGQAGLRTIFVL